ncbi:hypothetical protein Ddye_020350 [Dipteronia dyeriana]|uniref:Polygalacturonase n=1 Tax=Dipteronia dyeriana TaxID=168575 RepID=A0AAD9TZJ0_9ROSI|nr:hypothetical protein Ddye_020350 [Dipteronia dyeriana]
MDFVPGVLLIFYIVVVTSSLIINIGENQRSFNVVDYGAIGDGQTDDSAILGEILAPASVQAWKDYKSKCWLCFNYVNGLIVKGSGAINGRGSAWWKALYLHSCNNFNLREFTVQNSQKFHIAINNCNGGSISNIHINSHADSPNTDGINLANSTQVHIHDSLIKCGDDCVAINDGCKNINVTRIACGPGHGISVGSLGDGEMDTVDQVYVRNCEFCTSELRVIVDVHGTSANEQAITLDCNSSVKGCRNIIMKQVNITSSKSGNEIRALCKTAHGFFDSTKPHVSCS